MKTTTHKYRGYIITSFNLRQLGDSSVRGRSYNVYLTEGGQSLSASECLTTLAAAREFVDALIRWVARHELLHLIHAR